MRVFITLLFLTNIAYGQKLIEVKCIGSNADNVFNMNGIVELISDKRFNAWSLVHVLLSQKDEPIRLQSIILDGTYKANKKEDKLKVKSMSFSKHDYTLIGRGTLFDKEHISVVHDENNVKYFSKCTLKLL